MHSFNGRLRGELLRVEIFDTLLGPEVLTRRWRRYYSVVMPHSALNYGLPASEAVQPWPQGHWD